MTKILIHDEKSMGPRSPIKLKDIKHEENYHIIIKLLINNDEEKPLKTAKGKHVKLTKIRMKVILSLEKLRIQWRNIFKERKLNKNSVLRKISSRNEGEIEIVSSDKGFLVSIPSINNIA
jgi:hypothetical protein